MVDKSEYIVQYKMAVEHLGVTSQKIISISGLDSQKAILQRHYWKVSAGFEK